METAETCSWATDADGVCPSQTLVIVHQRLNLLQSKDEGMNSDVFSCHLEAIETSKTDGNHLGEMSLIIKGSHQSFSWRCPVSLTAGDTVGLWVFLGSYLGTGRAGWGRARWLTERAAEALTPDPPSSVRHASCPRCHCLLCVIPPEEERRWSLLKQTAFWILSAEIWTNARQSPDVV